MNRSAPDAKSALIEDLKREIREDRRLGKVPQATGLGLWIEADGTLLIEGQVPRVAHKKIVLRIAAAHPQVVGVIDRLRVAPAEPMSDAMIRNHLRTMFGSDVTLNGIAVVEIRQGRPEEIAEAPGSPWRFDYEVTDGIVTLNGRVSDLAVKRYIGVIAWWVPGSRDVINGIVADGDETDGPDRIADAVRAVLARDPFVPAGQIKVGVRQRVVRLTGLVPDEGARSMAENDAWYVFGVDDVINEITVGTA